MSTLSNNNSNSNNPLKAAASRFVQGVDDDDVSSSSSSWDNDEELAASNSGAFTLPTSTSATRHNNKNYENAQMLNDLEREKLVSHETKLIQRVRWLGLSVVLLLGAVTAWGTFRVMRVDDTPVPAQTTTVTHSQQTRQRLEQVQRISHALGQVVTAAAASTNATLPFFQLPHFEQFAVEALTTPGVQAILFAPIVQREQQPAWEAYLQHGVVTQSTGEYTLPVSQMATRPQTNAAAASDGFLATPHRDLLLQHESFARVAQLAMQQQQSIWSGILEHKVIMGDSVTLSLQSYVMVPIQTGLEQPSTTAGFMVALVDWEHILMGHDHREGDDYQVLYEDCNGTTNTATTFTNGLSGQRNSYNTVNNPYGDMTLIRREQYTAAKDDALAGLCSVRKSSLDSQSEA